MIDVLICALHRPIQPTGVCRHAVNLSLCLAELPDIGHVYLMIGVWQKEYFEASFDISSEKIQLIAIDIKNNSLARNQWFLFGLPKWANRLKSDLVHLAFPIPFFRQLFHMPVVSTIHDLYPYEKPENFGYPNVLFNQFFLGQCVRGSDAIACVSNVTSEALKHYFPKATVNKLILTIYNYTNLDTVTIQPPQNQKLDIDSPFLLCVAQHRKNKNLNLLISSYADMKKKGQLPKHTQIVLVGSDGPETNNLRQLTKTLSLTQVFMLSGLADGELSWLYKHCLAFVIASSTEGFCIPLVEALVSGSRVVCSDIPIFREVGTKSCTYFALEGNAMAHLSHAIVRALTKEPSDIQKIENFSQSAVAKKYLYMYSQILFRQ